MNRFPEPKDTTTGPPAASASKTPRKPITNGDRAPQPQFRFTDWAAI